MWMRGAARCGPDTGSLEIPACTVVKEYDGFEVREYDTGLMWADAHFDSLSYREASFQGFEACFGYISGANDKNETIEMTGPVRMQPGKQAAPGSAEKWTVSFFVPSKFASRADVPVPLANNMEIEAPARTFKAVAGPFGGFPGERDYQRQLSNLVKAVEAAGLKVASDADVTYAGYSSPFTVIGRHQEVWIDVEAPPTAAA
eukprot:PRCOL_00003286-RA